MSKEYKYKAAFAAQIKPIVSEEVDKYLAIASEANFKKYLPKDIDFNEKIDFLGFAGEAFIGNRLNSNDDGVSTDEAIRLANLFPMSFVDVDHNRNKLCGVITNASYSEFGTGKELTLEEVKKTKSPFSVIVGGIIWRVPNPNFAEAIEKSSDPSSEYYNKFFLSWEVMFSDSKLIVMDKSKANFEDGKIIEDESEIEKLEGKLKAFGGQGVTDDGKRIGRVIGNDCIPAAVGIVESPAAAVKPIITTSDNSKIQIKSSKSYSYSCPSCANQMDMENEMDDNENYTCAKCKDTYAGKKWKKGADVEMKEESKSDLVNGIKIIGEIAKRANISLDELLDLIKNDKEMINKNGETIAISIEKIPQDIKNSQISNSQSSKTDVNQININNKTNKINKVMLKTLANLKDEDLKEITASEVVKAHKIDLDTEVERISNEWQEKKNKVDNELKASNDKLAEAEKKMTETEEKLQKVQEDLNKLIEANEKREQEEIFNTRMNYFDGEYDLSDEKIRNIVARKIKGANEDQYKEAKEEIELLLENRKKTQEAEAKTQEKTEEKKTEEVKASTEKDETVIDDAIDNGKKEKGAVAATTTPTETNQQKADRLFGIDNWEVDTRYSKRNR